MNREKEPTRINPERVENTLILVGTSITLSGIGVIVSGGATGKPEILGAGAAAMGLGLFLYSAGRLINSLR